MATDLQLARVTLELLRPVPLAPLRVTSAVVRPGRKVQLVDTVVEADGRRGGVVAGPAHPGGPRRSPRSGRRCRGRRPGPPSGRAGPTSPAASHRAFHNEGVEMRYRGGRLRAPRARPRCGSGCGARWCWARSPRRGSGWRPSPTSATGSAAELAFGSNLFINPDLTVSVHRPPVGEWVCLDARTRFGTPGIGAAESALWDGEGRIGRAVQSLVVEVGR